MLVFPESGEGTDQPTLSINLFEHTGQCCCIYRYQVAACNHRSNDLLTAGSLKYWPFQDTSDGAGRLDTTSTTQHARWGNRVRMAWWMKHMNCRAGVCCVDETRYV
jgi:hypothetical protein